VSALYRSTNEGMARLQPYSPENHGKPRVDDRVLSGIGVVNRNRLRWRDVPIAYGPHKMLYNRWKRWGERGVFLRMMEGLAADAEPKTIMIDATYLKAHRTASSLRAKRMARPEQSAKTYPAFRREVVGQDGDPRVLVLIKGPVSGAILSQRGPGHRSTVRPSFTYLPQTSSSRRKVHRLISFTPPVGLDRKCAHDAAAPRRCAPSWPPAPPRRCCDGNVTKGCAARRQAVCRSCSWSVVMLGHHGRLTDPNFGKCGLRPAGTPLSAPDIA
jgi:transposase